MSPRKRKPHGTPTDAEYARHLKIIANATATAQRVINMPKDERALHFGFAMAVKTLESFVAHHTATVPNPQLEQLADEWIVATNRILDYCYVAGKQR